MEKGRGWNHNYTALTMMEQGLHHEVFHECSELFTVPGYHCHDFYEFYFHVAGGKFFGVDDGVYELEPYQLFVMPPFAMHGLSPADDRLKNYHRGYINIRPELMKSLGMGALNPDQFLREYTNQGHLTCRLTPERGIRCLELMDTLKASGSPANAVDAFRIQVILAEFLLIVCESLQHSENNPQRAVSSNVMQQVLTYINRNYTQPLSTEQIAREFGISVSSLSHEFARFTNRSVYDYILYRRITLARQLLTTEETLNNIAFQCGFNDYSNFLRMFNKQIGMSPGKYRKQLMTEKKAD